MPLAMENSIPFTVGHSLYYSIVSMIQSSEGTKLCFINNNNIDRVHDEILKQIR